MKIPIRVYKKSDILESIEGFFILDNTDKKVLKNDNYDFTYYLNRNLNAAFIEDKTIEELWFHTFDSTTYEEFYKEKRIQLIKEISEYYFLSKFSSFLDSINLGTNAIKYFEREEMSEILESNRFLNLFTKPTEQRQLFSFSKIDAFYTEQNGAIYNCVKPLLPRESVFTRNHDGSFSIDNDCFSLTVKTDFEDQGTVVPIGFMEKFLEIKNKYSTYPAYTLNFIIDVSFENQSDGEEILVDESLEVILKKTYYSKIKDFLKELNKEFGMDYYFNQKLQWEQTSVIIDLFQKRLDKAVEMIIENFKLRC